MNSSYRYSAPSAIDEVVFAKTENGSLRAYLHAAEGTPPEALHALTAPMHAKTWITVPVTLEDRHYLEVRGFGKEKDLLKELEAKKAVEGKPAVEKLDAKSTLWESIQKRSLQISGLLYGVGDGGFIMYGMKEANRLDIAGGIFYALGTASLVAFGQNDQADLQIREKAKAMEQFLIKENVRIPPKCSLYAVTEDPNRGLIGEAYDWARSHPSELFNTIYIGAGALIASGAMHGKILRVKPGELPKDRFKRLTAGWMDFALGTTTASVSLLGNLIREKKPDPDEPPPKGAWQKLKAWVQEKPLRVTGYGLMASTMCHAGSTTIEYFQARKLNDQKALSAVPWRALFVATNLLAEGLLAISSKGHGEGVTIDDSVKNSVYALAAEIITQQPREQRETYIQHIAGFLERPTMLAETYEAVEQELRKQVALVEKNPWFCNEEHSVLPPAPAASASMQLAAPHQSRSDRIPQVDVQPATITPNGASLQIPLH